MRDNDQETTTTSEPSVHAMASAQRAFELRKVFAPELLQNPGMEQEFNDQINADGALNAYSETIAWRLNAKHAMISLVDRGEQYFIAGALRQVADETSSREDDDEEMTAQRKWFGCASVSLRGGLCQHAIALDPSADQYPVFQVNDLSQDTRFSDLPVVDGTLASYRFYAGTPITTDHNTNIGTLFMFDDKPRPDGLSRRQKAILRDQANNVMRHLTTKREAAERRRAALMSQGIARFLDMTAEYRDVKESDLPEHARPPPPKPMPEHSGQQDADLTETPSMKDIPAQASVLDKIRKTLDHAAEILRESLEITTGGVVFLDTSLANIEIKKLPLERNGDMGATSPYQHSLHRGRRSDALNYTSPGPHLSTALTRSSSDKHSTPKILAASIPKSTLWSPHVPSLTTQTLANLISCHSTGNVWSIDEDGVFSSFREVDNWERQGINTPEERKNSLTQDQLQKAQYEAKVLSEIFPQARQIVFLPLWDAGSNRWYSGTFIWSQSAIPVFTVEAELTYLSSFTNSMMVEISRLDAVTANKMKSDFLGSISHEFRSPLHGILVSAEFLRDSRLDNTQSELVGTIQNCSGTLLDTINHVLDYSKINSFEIAGNKEDATTSQLYQVANLALLCETVVEGLIAANIFRDNPNDDGARSSFSDSNSPVERRDRQHVLSRPEIILDIEDRDWNFKVEAGALQRIIMNLAGNAQKFTTKGFILISMSIVEQQAPDNPTLLLRIRDTGKGISPEFMERKLYAPFAQEDSFVPGVGLGLSIVWSIVNQLGGTIDMKSEMGKGTDVQVSLEVMSVDQSLDSDRKTADVVLPDAQLLLSKIRARAAGKSVSIAKRRLPFEFSHTELAWKLTEGYLSGWFGFTIKQSPTADIVVTSDYEDHRRNPSQRTLLIGEESVHPVTRKGEGLVFMSNPLGPFKLARGILALLDQEIYEQQESSSDESLQSTMEEGTQVYSEQLTERKLLDGLVLTDRLQLSTAGTSVISNHDSANLQQTPLSKENLRRASRAPSATEMILSLPDRSNVSHSRRSSTSSSKEGSPTPSVEVLPPAIVPQAIPLPSSPPKSPHVAPTLVRFASELSASKARTRPSSISDVQKRSLRILAVDDNGLNLQLLYRYLQKRKQDVIETATDGVEAVNKVEKSDAYDIIFMDISMPNMDGFEATRLIRSFERSQWHKSTEGLLDVSVAEALSPVNQTTEGVNETVEGIDGITRLDAGNVRQPGASKSFIVALTGLASRRDRDEAQQSGFDDFLTKPISFKRIGELLDRLSWEK